MSNHNWYKKLIWFAGVVLLLSTIPPASQAQVVNLAPLNNSFEEEDDVFDWGGGWVTWNSDAGNGSTITYDDTEFIDGAKSLRLDAKGTIVWDFMILYTEIPLEVGQEYTVSVWAKAAEARNFVMLLKAMDNSTTWGNTTFNLTEEWAEFTITAQAQNQNSNVKVIIHCAGTEIPMWLDSFYVYEGPYVESINKPELPVQGKATDPKPETEATDVPRDVVLSWTPGEFVAELSPKHKVFFSENFDDVNDGIGGITQDPNIYPVDTILDFGKTYYWRVDEADSTSGWEQGLVWQFTVEPFAYLIPGENITATASSSYNESTGPENTVNGSGLDADDLHSAEQKDMWLSSPTGPQPTWIQYEFDRIYKLHEMWLWNFNQAFELVLGFGLKDVTIEYSADGIDWVELAGVPEFAQASGAVGYAHDTTLDFGGLAAKYVKITANSNWGFLNQYGLSEVGFFYIPLRAREPQPESGATGMDLDVTLGFRAGREATMHDVYFSSDRQAVVDGIAPVTTVTENSYGPLFLDLGTTYYWRVDEVNDTETPTTWQGDVWNFRTHEYFVVDDFEDYNDYPPVEIFSTWIDGYGTTTNGSTAGYPDPDFLAGEHYVETTIVHGGAQSMPLFYDNNFKYSEAAMTLSSQRDWTVRGVGVLSLWFYGDAANAAERMYVALNGSAVVYHDDPSAAQIATWTEWPIDLQEFAAQGQGVNLANVNTIAIGFGDKNNLQAGGSGMVFFDDIRLYRPAQ